MRIPIIDAIVEKREVKRRKAKMRKILIWVAAVSAALLSVCAAVFSVVRAVKRCRKSCAEGKCKIKAALAWLKEKLTRNDGEEVYYVDGFNADDEDEDEPDDSEDDILF